PRRCGLRSRCRCCQAARAAGDGAHAPDRRATRCAEGRARKRTVEAPVSAFAAPELWPFTLAAILMIAVAVAEAVALMIGASMLHWHDGAAADPPDGFVGDALGWLHFGKVP